MKLKNAQRIVKCLEAEGTEASLYEDYSGRGMWGTTTTAVAADDSDDVLRVMGVLGIEDTRRVDSLGYGYVAY